MDDKLTASEAVYGFCGWLTSRDEETVMSSRCDASKIAELVEQFCEENGLGAPRDNWTDNLIHPSGQCSLAICDEHESMECNNCKKNKKV